MVKKQVMVYPKKKKNYTCYTCKKLFLLFVVCRPFSKPWNYIQWPIKPPIPLFLSTFFSTSYTQHLRAECMKYKPRGHLLVLKVKWCGEVEFAVLDSCNKVWAESEAVIGQLYHFCCKMTFLYQYWVVTCMRVCFWSPSSDMAVVLACESAWSVSCLIE